MVMVIDNNYWLWSANKWKQSAIQKGNRFDVQAQLT